MADVISESTSDKNLHYFTKCMDLCQLLGNKNGNFLINVKIENIFNFTVKHSSIKNLSDKDSVKHKDKTVKKYVSPSTRKRNMAHLA